ncbi:MAG TPA: PP2C family protein-serine/threonine phosphatase [Acidobacteriaceae bacterium]|nr:PP2C family protein-serine/threonine phosphatase [Acidobacteriaceae bacterium]
MRGLRYFFPAFLLSLLLPTVALKADAQQQVTLGNATVPLTGLWKFRTGDNMAWAQPGFDDSGWGTMDLTPPPGSYDPIFGSSGYVPGWTARGYKGYSGYAWYRLRVNVQSGQTALALKMPNNIDDAYQIYVNGRLIGQFGKFSQHGVTSYNALPRAFPLPANLHSGPATIAIRMWMSADTPLINPDVGGLHGPPVLGHASAIANLLRLDWDSVDRLNESAFFESAILLLALLVAFALFWLDRREPAYLWLGITCVAVLVNTADVVASRYWTGWWGTSPSFILIDAVLTPLWIGLWVIFWAYWFRLGGMGRIHRIVWSLVVLLGIGTAMLRAPLYGSVVPVHAIVWLSPLTLALKLLLGAVLVGVTVLGIRKNRTEGWLALPAIVLVAFSLYTEELIVLHVPLQWFPFGAAIGLRQVGTVLSLIIITVLLLRRFLHGQREREQWKLEIEQARQVQQMLIPEALPQIPGLTIESEYRPARVVGGDFFQIIEGNDDSVLIILGDVSGKGLKAAMLVSLIVGTIRTLAKFTRDPMEVLRGLNERLCGRMQGHFATCLALHVAANGEATVVNAGHLVPYLNGKEIAIAGSLPLGIVEAAEFEQTSFTLQPGDRLTMMTDGVVEAQNEKRELFGFARTHKLMREDKSAVEIAAIAQVFGQEDDITVLSITRAPNGEAAIA